MVLDGRHARIVDAIQRHVAWADEFLAVGDFVGVMEELGDAAALAAEMVDDTLQPEPVH